MCLFVSIAADVLLKSKDSGRRGIAPGSRCGLGRMEPDIDPVTGEVVYAKPRPDRKKAKPQGEDGVPRSHFSRFAKNGST